MGRHAGHRVRQGGQTAPMDDAQRIEHLRADLQLSLRASEGNVGNPHMTALGVAVGLVDPLRRLGVKAGPLLWRTIVKIHRESSPPLPAP